MYQPVVDAKTEQLIGAEALLRCPAATVMTANMKAKAEDLLNQIQYAAEDGRDTSLLEKDLRNWQSFPGSQTDW